MRKNILAVLTAFEHGQSKKVGPCSTDGETVYSYNTPIARRFGGSSGKEHFLVREENSTQTTNQHIRAFLVQFKHCVIQRRESI